MRDAFSCLGYVQNYAGIAGIVGTSLQQKISVEVSILNQILWFLCNNLSVETNYIISLQEVFSGSYVGIIKWSSSIATVDELSRLIAIIKILFERVTKIWV